MSETNGGRLLSSSSETVRGGTDTPVQQRLRVADWTVDPVANRLIRGEQVVRLEPKVMSVLLYLAARPRAVVSRRELEDRVWAGTVVSYDTVTGAVQKVRKALGDDPRHPRMVETISKRGYRLIAPVSTAEEEPPSTGLDPASGLPLRRPRLALAATRLALGLVLLAAALEAVWYVEWAGSRSSAPTQPQAKQSLVGERPSLAVLPFANASGDPRQDYFGEGMTDDLITNLSRIPSLSVAARSRVSADENASADAAEVGRRLGVRYLLRGKVHKEGEHLRIDAELLDTTARDELWSERFEGNLGDLFRFQSAIVDRTASALAGRAATAGRPPPVSHHIPKPEAFDLYLRGRAALAHLSLENLLAARAFFEQAVRADPNFARAYAALANTHSIEADEWWSGAPHASLRQAKGLASRAVELDSALAEAHYALAAAYIGTGDLDRAAEEARKGIALDTGSGDGHVILASVLTYAGRPTESLREYRRARGLNLPQSARYLLGRGQTYFTLGDYSEAIRLLDGGFEQDPAAPRLRVWLAAAYAQAGRVRDADWLITELHLSRPKISVSRVAATVPYRRKSDLDRLVAGLRKAGLHE